MHRFVTVFAVVGPVLFAPAFAQQQPAQQPPPAEGQAPAAGQPAAEGGAEAPVSGMIASGAPTDIFLEVTTGPGGEPVLSEEEFQLVLGSYYRFNFVCPDAQDDSTGFHLEVTDLLANSHLRVVSVSDIEIYMQGMTFRAIECDEAGAARFSFHPMRRGVYDIYVREHSDPPQEAFGRIVVD
jgi:hypothetical protein